ncbi:MAG: response regulator [Clostridiales Family XIII bacterium]|jgi:putative two-component system response regulator|nr:response regulator [Clostridiales Family XIII bacterium]
MDKGNEIRKKIMLVDDNLANLTAGKTMLKEHYEVFAIPSAAKLFDFLNHVTPDLILLDIEMPDMNGYDAIKQLKGDKRYADIPVIFVTAKTDEGSELEGLALGAIDYVTKPFSAPLLLKRIENHVLMAKQKRDLLEFNDNLQLAVFNKTSQVMELQNAVLSTVAEMVEFRDEYTGGHVDRTQRFLKLLVDRMIASGVYEYETREWDLAFLLPSAQLHDVGKISISDTILNKPGKLTDEEFEIMKKHPSIGVNAIKRIEENASEHDFLYHAEIFAGSHHEKWDGSGYPNKMSGSDIPLQGRLMAIADVYDALISVRPYKKPMTVEIARKIILEGKGSHFDPALVDIFTEVEGDFAAIAKEYQAQIVPDADGEPGTSEYSPLYLNQKGQHIQRNIKEDPVPYQNAMGT